jgi:hypothetical protein
VFFPTLNYTDWGKPWEILGPNFKPELAGCGSGLLDTWFSCFKIETSVPPKIWFKEKVFASRIFCSDFM